MVRFDPVMVIYFVVALVPAMILHELSHGILADRMGDHTPRMAGRLTLNPARHVDPFGTVIVPGLLLLPVLFGQQNLIFGYAKPMPMTAQNLRDPRRHVIWIAAVGPITNLMLALIGAVLLRLAGGPGAAGPLTDLLIVFVYVNVLVAVFHLLPIPPLDGSKVVGLFLSGRAGEVYRSWDQFGALFILVIFFIFPGPVFSFVSAIADGLIGLLV